MGNAHRNSEWIGRVKTLLIVGYGAEGIAIKTGSDPDDVRREIQILRDEGTLVDMWPARGVVA